MSRERLTNRPDYPIRFTNEQQFPEGTVPAFGLMGMFFGERGSDGKAVLGKAYQPDSYGEPLYVNSPNAVPEGAADGHCRSVLDGPFWVALDPGEGLPNVNDTVGPAGTYYASTDGTGLTVLFVHETLRIALCHAQVGNEVFALLQLTSDNLEECGDAVPAYFVIDEDCHRFQHQAGTTVDICPSSGWKGVAFGGTYPGTASDNCNFADLVLARYYQGRWYAVGAGYTTLLGTAGADIDQNEVGAFTVQIKIGGCHDALWNAAPNTSTSPIGQCGEETREVTVPATSRCGDIEGGSCATLIWNGQAWDAVAGSANEWGCGLQEDGGEVSVDNTAIAGTGLAAEGECAVGLSPDTQDTLAQVPVLTGLVAALDAALAALTDIVEELVECCDDSRECCEASMTCCYETTEAIDYIAEFCCEGLVNVPGVGDCSGKCVWRSTGSAWELIVPCAGPDNCECSVPTYNGEPAGDLKFTECTSAAGMGVCCCAGDLDECVEGVTPEECDALGGVFDAVNATCAAANDCIGVACV